ncbi:class I SAM-dependent methyltransferase [Plantactinospora veratri]|uniref:Class I SAM-dependent methyltransferase n=1 Tax=Plantactinospora veratri TaxID=1436122 RepID=A0ABU7S6X2_9ACTN
MYTGAWSRAEDRAVLELLGQMTPHRPPRVLDLGCGTGLGYELTSAAFADISYTGRDISTGMLGVLGGKYPHVSLSRGPMDDLHDLPRRYFDLVTAFSMSASYAGDLGRLLTEVEAVLATDGWVYLSFLNRTALRRIIRGRCRPTEVYWTRGVSRVADLGAPTHTVARRQIVQLLSSAGLQRVAVENRGTFSGVVEWPPLWQLSTLLDRAVPFLGHTYEVVARKRDQR